MHLRASARAPPVMSGMRPTHLLMPPTTKCHFDHRRDHWRTRRHSPPQWTPVASEHQQALARSVVQACFNLIESFISGLAREHIIDTPALPAVQKEKLFDSSRSLRARVLSASALIGGGAPPISEHVPPFAIVFGRAKQRRDAFVHCEPGADGAKLGYVKETAFHDVTISSVTETVIATEQLIRHTCRRLKHTPSPRWLASFEDPASLRVGLTLVPLV